VSTGRILSALVVRSLLLGSLLVAGFATRIQTIGLEIGQTLGLEITRAVGELAEQVAVQSRVPFLHTATAEISDVIGNREVVQLPLHGRS
jgi:hypothetical protein